MEYVLKKSKRKTLSIEINTDMIITVKVPLSCSQKEIESFVNSNRDWIEKSLLKIENRNKNAEAFKISEEEREKYIKKAKETLPQRVKYWSEITGLTPAYVKITSAEKRYGSCNGRNGICLSYRIMAYPKEAVDYVIVHELAHIKYKNHGRDFYKLIEKYLPEYKKYEKILKHQGES